MLGKGKLKSGTKTLYKDSGLKNPWPKTANSTPEVDILEQYGSSYKVYVHSDLFNPRTVYVKKSDVVNIKLIQTNQGGQVVLETGDTMILTDKNGKRLGVFTFKKD